MAQPVLHLRGEFGDRHPQIRKEKDRVISESAATDRFLRNNPPPTSIKGFAAPVRRGVECENTTELGSPFFGRDLPERMQEFSNIAGIVCRLTGISCRANSGRTIQRIDLKSRIVGQCNF